MLYTFYRRPYSKNIDIGALLYNALALGMSFTHPRKPGIMIYRARHEHPKRLANAPIIFHLVAPYTSVILPRISLPSPNIPVYSTRNSPRFAHPFHPPPSESNRSTTSAPIYPHDPLYSALPWARTDPAHAASHRP